MLWLFIFTLAVSLYDWRTRRIPNWYSLPLLIAGLIAHFPGNQDLWFASLVLLIAWTMNWMSAGDAKLWITLLWALPIDYSSQALPLMFTSFLLTGLGQIIWRIVGKQSLTKSLTPGAWRTIPFVLMCWYVH
jgi:Flp pilus assembly protein protease CpaA